MKKLVWILSALLLVTVGVGTSLWLQHREHRSQIAALQAQASTSPAKPASLPAPASVADLQILPAPAASPLSPQRIAQDAERRARSDAATRALNRPEDRDIRRAQIQLQMIPRMFPDVASELNLSPEEVNRLFELLATLQTEFSDTSSIAFGNSDPDSGEVQEARRRLQAAPREKEERLAALLGSKFPQWQEFEKAAPARRQVKELQAVLASGDHALGSAQARPLIAALAAERARLDQDDRDAMAARVDFAEIRKRRAREESRRLPEIASAYLTPAQLDRFQRMFVRQAEAEGPLSVLRNQRP